MGYSGRVGLSIILYLSVCIQLMVCQDELPPSTLPNLPENADGPVDPGVDTPLLQTPSIILTTLSNVKAKVSNEDEQLLQEKHKNSTKEAPKDDIDVEYLEPVPEEQAGEKPAVGDDEMEPEPENSSGQEEPHPFLEEGEDVAASVDDKIPRESQISSIGEGTTENSNPESDTQGLPEEVPAVKEEKEPSEGGASPEPEVIAPVNSTNVDGGNATSIGGLDNVPSGNNGIKDGKDGTTVSQDAGMVVESTTKPIPTLPALQPSTTIAVTTKAITTTKAEKMPTAPAKETTTKFVTLTDKEIEVDVGGSTDSPPYVHVTDKPPVSPTPHNDSFVVVPGPGEVKDTTFFTPKMIGILVGAAVGLILIVGIIAVTIVALKRRRHKKKHNIAIIENPRYMNTESGSGPAHNYRFSGDASLLIGGPTLSQSALANNNVNEKNDMNFDRKKRRAPPAPNPFTGKHDAFPLRQDSSDYYEKPSNKKKNKAPPPPNPFTGELDCLSNPNAIQYFEQLLKNKKRRAPPPPNPFTGKLDEPISQTIYYEKDSPHGSEMELSTFTSGLKKDRATNDNDTPEADRLTPQAAHSGPEAEEGEDPEIEEPESQTLLSDIEREGGFNLTRKPPSQRQSSADHYQFSDDEEARESRDYYRQESFDNYSSDDDLDNTREDPYEVSDIQEELPQSDEDFISKTATKS